MTNALEAVEERWILIDGVDGQPLQLPALVGLNRALPAAKRYQAAARLPLSSQQAVWVSGEGAALDGALQDLVKNAKARVADERKRARARLT
jgi:hypothetical protein